MSYYVIDEDDEGQGGQVRDQTHAHGSVGGFGESAHDGARLSLENDPRVLAQRYGQAESQHATTGARSKQQQQRREGKGRYRDDDDDELEIPLQGNGHRSFSFLQNSGSFGEEMDLLRNRKGWKGMVICLVLVGFLIIALSIALAKSRFSLDSLKGEGDGKGTGGVGFDDYYGGVDEKEDELRPHIGSGADGRNLTGEHPIYSLLEQATVLVQNKTDLAKQLEELEFSRQYYQSRYGKTIPKSFDQWHAFAQKWKSKAEASIQSYDSMMNQLLPFRAVHPYVLRQRIWNSNDSTVIFTIHDHKVSAWSTSDERYEGSDPTVVHVREMLSRLADQLGDLEFAFNLMDESRTTLSFETREAYTKSAIVKEYLVTKESTDVSPTWLVDALPEGKPSNYKKLDPSAPTLPDPTKETEKYMSMTRSETEITGWQLMSESCPPESAARLTPRNPLAGHSFTSSITANGVGWQGQFRNASATAVGGFLKSLEGMLDICIQPDIQDLAGFAIRPNQLRVIRDQVFPIFSTSRVSGFSDILMPGRQHWQRPEKDQKKLPSWKARDDKLYWRGSTSGALIKGYEWHGSHRQRLIARVHRARGSSERETVLIDKPISNKNHGSTPHLGTVTLNAFDLDSGLTNCMLTGVSNCESQACNDMLNSSSLVFGNSTAGEQANQRYVLDLDDNGASHDFIAHLRTGAMVLKSTVMEEFFTKSLVPWYHFVPLEIRYLELYNILTWFRGFSGPTFEPRTAAEKALTESEIRAIESSLESSDAGPKPPFLEDWINRRLALRAVEHSEKARLVGDQGRRFAMEQLRQSDCLVYLYRLLVEWQDILQIGGEGGEPCQFGGCLSANQEPDLQTRPWQGEEE